MQLRQKQNIKDYYKQESNMKPKNIAIEIKEITNIIPTLNDCAEDLKNLPSWEELSEAIYQSEKALFLMKKLANGHYHDSYRWGTPNIYERMDSEGVLLYQQAHKGEILPSQAFCTDGLARRFGDPDND